MTYNEMIAELQITVPGWIEMNVAPSGYIGMSYTRAHGFMGVVVNPRRADFTLDKVFVVDGRKKGESVEVRVGLVRLADRDVASVRFMSGIDGVKSYTSYQDIYRESAPKNAVFTTGIEWYEVADGTATVSVPTLVKGEGDLFLMDGYPKRCTVKVVDHVVKTLNASDCGVGGKDRSKVISWAATLQPGATFLDRAEYLVINDTGVPVVVQKQTYTEDWGDSSYGGHFE